MAQQPEEEIGLKIVVCGGGNAAHVFAGLAASINKANKVCVLSLYDDEAKRFELALNNKKDNAANVGKLKIELTQEKKEILSTPYLITNEPQKCLPNADVVIISLPAFAHSQYLNAINKYVGNHQCFVGVFPGASGLECDWQSIIGSNKNSNNYILLSCITLPWACRIKQFGINVEILGTKNSVKVSVYNYAKKEALKQKCIAIFQKIIGKLPVLVDAGHLLAMSLGAINAIVHPSIMYGKWKNYDGIESFKTKPLFYQGVSVSDVTLLTDVSNEIIFIANHITKESSIKLNIPTIYEWYKNSYGSQCKDSSNLYNIIIQNPGYNGLTHPMIKNDKDCFVPNFKYRYLTEDIPMGLVVIKGIALLLKQIPKTPVLDTLIQWAQKVMKKEYFVYDNNNNVISVGKDIKETRAPQKYNFKDIQQLL